MRRLISAIAFGIFLIANAFGQCQPNFFDGFESGSYSPTWTVGTGGTAWSVQSGSAALGNYYLDGASATSSTHLQGLVSTIPSSQPTTISWDIRPTNANGAGNYVVIGDAAISSTNCLIFSYWQPATNAIRFVASSTLDIPASINNWYHIELRNINFGNHTFDLYINNTLISSAFPFRSASVNSVTNIHIYNYASGSNGNWDNILIGEYAPMMGTAIVNNVPCYGDADGNINLTMSGGEPSYSYLWSTGDTTSSLSNLSPATYTVTVTDSLACTYVDSFQVTEPTQLANLYNYQEPSCYGFGDGQIIAQSFGGTPSYTYQWSTGDSTAAAPNLPAGSYVLVTTDSMGCSTTDTLPLGEPLPILVADSIMMPTCNGLQDGSIVTQISGGTGTLSYFWSTGDTTSSIFGIGAGTYTIQVGDSMGCQTLDSIIVSEPAAISASATLGDDTGSNNGSIDLTVAGGTPGYTFSWSNGATTEDLSNLPFGTYTVLITDQNGCTTTDSFVVSLSISAADAQAIEMSASPNPFHQDFVLRLSTTSTEALDVIIMDLSGRVVWSLANTKERTIQVNADLAAGMYFLKVRQGEEVATMKLVKE